ncbi:MAG: nucleotidyltransferase family protein [Terriglobia bacterium]
MANSQPIALRDLNIAQDFARRLGEQVSPQLFQITLFGSRARGEADEESDLDLFIALKENDPQGKVKETASHIACDLTLEYGMLVSVFVADSDFLEQHDGFAFLETVREEGVPL